MVSGADPAQFQADALSQRGEGTRASMTDSPASDDPRLEDGPWRDGLDDKTVEAVGAMTEALETTEVARGHLYAFHQLTGSADLKLEKAIELLEAAGHDELAEGLRRDLLGRNVLPGRWTFQVVEGYEETYYQPFRACEKQVRELTRGLPHVHEADLKRQRRSPGRAGHEASPQEPAAGG